MDNLGDEVLFRTLIRSCERYGDVYIKGKSTDYAVARSSGSVWELRARRIIHRLAGGVTVHLAVPGGDVPKYMRRGRDFSHQPSLPRWARLASFLREVRCVFGRSFIAPINNHYLNTHLIVGARDHASLEVLRNEGVRDARYFPDLSFLLSSDNKKRRCAYKAGDDIRVGFSFRAQVPDLSEHIDLSVPIRILMLEVNRSLSREPCLDLIGYYQVDEDAEFNSLLAKELQVTYLNERLVLDNYRKFYSNIDVIISNRLHCLLFAAVSGAIPIAAVHPLQTKVLSLFQTVDWWPLVLDVTRPHEVNESIRKIFDGMDYFRELVCGTVSYQRKLATTILDETFGARRSEKVRQAR